MEGDGLGLPQVMALLAAGVLAVPIFRRLGLGSVLGYLAAGVSIGPFGLGLVRDTAAILHVAELGVVLFMFVVGLELAPARLWRMRGEIFGLGLVQVGTCAALLTGAGLAIGLPPAVAFIAGIGFVMTSTAIVMQLLEERGAISTEGGRRIFAIMLLEDLTVVPVLALIALLVPDAPSATLAERAAAVAIGLGAIAALLAAGRWLLNPLFRLLAGAQAREVMTAAALLVVLGAALLLERGGLSMALGAFLAGVLLSGSAFRHQLEADVEPFRGILLGLFFIGVGMALDLGVVAAEWRLVLAGVVGCMALKMSGVYAVARLTRAGHREALLRAALMCQGGEFAFVLYAAAAASGVIDAKVNAVMTAVIVVSMALTPLVVLAHDRLLPKPRPSLDGVDAVRDIGAAVLLIGFGRFGQIVSQPLLARGHQVSLIDRNADAIREAADFGFKVYYGDGTRLDILRAAGAAEARAILVCIDDAAAVRRIATLARAEFPLVPVLARVRDREEALALLGTDVAFQIRETFESALVFGQAALQALGDDPETAAETIAAVRRRDAERLALQVGGDIYAGRELLHGNLAPRDPGHG